MSIKRVAVTKFHGVMVDEFLNWNEHIKLIKNKTAKGLAILIVLHCLMSIKY